MPNDPLDPKGIPDQEPTPRPITKFEPEWADHLALVRILLRNGVPAEAIEEISSAAPITDIEGMATVNARLMTLADAYGLPRPWLLNQMKQQKYRKTDSQLKTISEGDKIMGWLREAAGDMDMGRQLPTAMSPDKKGPLEESKGPSDMGMKPKAPSMGMPGKDDGKMGVNEVKSLLDKGDLMAAMEALKKLLPGGGDKGMPKAPELGKPAPKLGPKPEMGGAAPAPKAPEMAPKPAMAPMASKHIMVCGACEFPLEAYCPTCGDNLKGKAE